jgi:hypothetical protein
VFVLLHLDAIRQALQQGHVQKDIWQTLHDAGQMPISYRQFNKLIVQLVAAPPTVPRTAPREPAVTGVAGAAATVPGPPPASTDAGATPALQTLHPAPRQAKPEVPPTFNPIPDIQNLL